MASFSKQQCGSDGQILLWKNGAEGMMRERTEGETDGLREVEGCESCSSCIAAPGVISGWNEADSQTPPAMPHTVYK